MNVGESKEMQAMSLKKLQLKDPKKKYHIEYRNKKAILYLQQYEGETMAD